MSATFAQEMLTMENVVSVDPGPVTISMDCVANDNTTFTGGVIIATRAATLTDAG